MKRILLSVDLRDGIDAVIEHTYMLAQRFNAEVIPVHAIEYLPVYHRHAETALIRRHVQNHLDKVGDELRLRNVSVFEPIIAEGRAYDEVLRIAKALDVDLIIVGAGQNAKGHSRLALGSNAGRIVRKSQAPVWICDFRTDLEQLNRILCAVDFSDHSARTLETAIIISRALNGILNIVHVVPRIDYYPGLVDESIAVSPWGASAYTTDLYGPGLRYNENKEEEFIENEFAAFLKKFKLDGIDYHVSICHGSPHEQIRQLCLDDRSGLLVIGAKGSSNIFINLIGGTVEKLVNDIPCSLLTVK